ncbi:MAG: hypothetical protein ACO1OC_12745 [Tuberibacillus sp.]
MNMLPSIGRSEPLHNRNPRPSDGQIVKGKVIQLLNAEEAVVEINGRTIKASIEVPLKPGSSYLFQVFREPEGFHLKMIKEVPLGESNMNDSAEELVRYFGLPVDGRSKAIVRLFFHYNWPLNSSLLNQARRLLSLPNHEGDWNALKTMLARKWPLNESLFKALAAVENHQTAQSMNILLKELKQLNLASSLHDELASLLEHWPSMEGQDLNELLNRLKVYSTDTESEAVLLKWLVKTFPEHTESIQKGWPEARIILSKLNTPQDFGAFIRLIGLPLQHENDLLFYTATFQSFFGSFSGEWLKRILVKTGYFYEADLAKLAKGEAVDVAELKRSLKGLLLALSEKEGSADDVIRQTAQKLLQQISGQQLQSLHEDRSFIQLLFTFPLRFEDGLRDVQLFWEGKRQGDGKVDPEYCKIAFRLELPHIDETVVHILVQKRRMTVSIYNDHPLIEPLIRAHAGELSEALKKMGYDLVSVKRQTGSIPEAEAIFSPQAGNVDVRI